VNSETDREQAIIAWRAALGEVSVLTGDAMGIAARTTLPHGNAPLCVLRPDSEAAVSELVRIAALHKVPLYPVSRGRNWGYGDALPASPGTAIVDLSRMNQVREVNGERGYAVIEAGVSQQEIYDAVQQAAPHLWVDVTGAGPDASMVGNILDRGFGHTPYSDHLRSVLAMTIVLADGTIVRTGYGHYDKARADRVFPYGVGPVLDGLFSQGNYGIVVEATIALQPAPEAFRFFWIKVDDPHALVPLVDALRPLRLNGTLNSAVHIGNDLRVISAQRRYPWEAGEPPLSPEVLTRLRREAGVGAWNASGSLTGSPGQVRDAARALKRAVGSLGKVVFLDDRKLRLARQAANVLGRFGMGATLRRQVDALEPNYGLLKGIPTSAPLAGVHWRTRTACDPEADPRDTTCGLLWVSPVMPIRGEDAARVQAIATQVLADHGFDFMVTYTMLNERALVAVMNISFDREVPGEPEAAAACYEALLEALIAEGYYPYRATPQGMAHLHAPDDAFWETTRRLKAVLDPDGIIAPGRYIPE
jgi:4-cresol dehydrogenase (hydroxylating)